MERGKRADIVYREGIEESALLDGVNAYDSVDGDITDRIVIEKTMENRDDNTIVVFYAVNDKAGNVAKASRVFDAMYIEEDTESAAATNNSAPVLALRVSEVSINMGQKPAWVDVIETLRDDKDEYATLFYSLSVSEYDRNKAGTYEVTLSVEDSDGNRSEEVPLTIIVKDSGM